MLMSLCVTCPAAGWAQGRTAEAVWELALGVLEQSTELGVGKECSCLQIKHETGQIDGREGCLS